MDASAHGDLQHVTTAVRPSGHEQRYDRQLRLWASSGQSALESASILVINGSPTATQVLKNLVLPGVGHFSILDAGIVRDKDIGANFFLDSQSKGKKRAEVEVDLLREMNDSVKGSAILNDLDQFLCEDAPLASYSLVISVNSPHDSTVKLSKMCWEQNVTLITVQTAGFFGSMRTQVSELAFVETHPDSLVDLRLDAPFPALADYTSSIDFAALDSSEHGHLPAVVIVLRALVEYKSKNGGMVPKLTKDRNALKQIIASYKRSADEENFDEAAGLVIKLARPTAIPSEINNLFADKALESLSASSSPFWIMLAAVRQFVKEDPQGHLPLSGVLPDMKATSAGYLKLQSIYREKAAQDLATVKTNLSQILTSIGMPQDAISDERIATFVKHAAHLAVVRGTSYSDELHGTKGRSGSILAALNDEDNLLCWQLALQAASEYQARRSAWPATESDQTTDPIVELQSITQEILSRHEILVSDENEMPAQVKDALEEILRSGDCELPQIAALMGGIVAQEAIKLITLQYIPLNGTLIFDGIKSRTGIVSF